uniref:Uncharacterized protein n=1 Tax=Periophthalmus magnuspinnatus TaxID=409849 RepID=A0A3B4AQD1_9GOBI
MSNVSYHISNLLEKMTSTDKDFRFMATNDLMLELQKDSIKLDEDSERKVVTMLLRLLEDKNGEVQNLAVKCCPRPHPPPCPEPTSSASLQSVARGDIELVRNEVHFK